MFSAPGAGASMMSSSRCSCSTPAPSDIESHIDNVAVAHDVVATFEPLFATLTQHRIRAGVEQLLGVSHLGSDETARDVGVNARRSVERGLALAEVPGAHLGLAGGEERDQPEQSICAARDPVQPRLFDSNKQTHP